MCTEAEEGLDPSMGLSQADDIIQSHTQLGRWVGARVQLHKAPAPSAASLLRTPGGPDFLEATGVLPAQAWSSYMSLSNAQHALGELPSCEMPRGQATGSRTFS